MKKIYLDYAAATPVDKAVMKAMEPYFSERFYNPSALYLSAKSVTQDITKARQTVAGWLGAKPAEIIFTAGGTESDNLAIRGVMEKFPTGNLVVSAIEHEAVLEPAKLYKHKIAPVNPDGVVDLKTLRKLIDNTTVLVSIMYANNEIGTIEPLRSVGVILDEVRTERRKKGNNLPLYFHTDACQAANYLDLHVSRLGVDLMTLNAGKIYGPKQCGALYIGAEIEIAPQILGGGQERGQRSGTENVAAIVGFATALDLVQKNRHEEANRLNKLQKMAFKIIKERLPGAVINGSQKHRLPNNIHLTIPGQDNERLIMALDEKAILCAAGSACSASKEQPSHVLRATGLTDEEARSSLRLTMGQGTNENDLKYVLETFAELLD
ncbi:MAG TPA: cysteine desulfurase family protein [Patescibacteria group bacterium]|nr:cysteine desulfurase family protein [Patescibacteria group bacterium]